jgi:hypothetical protein
MSVFHQQLPEIKKMPLNELFIWATIAAGAIGKTFD